MHIVVHDKIESIEPHAWNQLLTNNNPFMRHEFLAGLEHSGCVSEQTGWVPYHLAVYSDVEGDVGNRNESGIESDKHQRELIAVMPCYSKTHSYGEYIFDWSWANAYAQHGIDYYPKLSNAIPFTPASGPRWLIKEGENRDIIIRKIIKKIMQIIDNNNFSGFHSLFLTEADTHDVVDQGLSIRHSSQFHWHNNSYASFDDFLSALSAKKRKNIKRERRRVKENEITFKWHTGDDLTEEHAMMFYHFYRRTISMYGAQAYLNQDFFVYLTKHLKNNTLFLFAYHKEQPIAGSIYFKSNDTLYGRYWGALADFDSVHFETCYYQAIQWCIENGFSRFEAGAQGEHKIARGLIPVTTYSAHWIQHPEFRTAIDRFIKEEQQHQADYNDILSSHSPFKLQEKEADYG